MRRTRWVDLLLLGAIVPLAVWAMRTGRERSRLEALLADYARQAGDISIPDRTKYYFQVVPTSGPTEFAWRVFQPAGPTSECIESPLGGSMSSNSGQSSEKEMLLRLSLREDSEPPAERIEVSVRSELGRQRFSLGDAALADLLRGRWDQVEAEQVGAGGLVVLDPGQPIVVLRLALSPALLAEAKTRSPELARRLTTNEIFRFTLNPEALP